MAAVLKRESEERQRAAVLREAAAAAWEQVETARGGG